MILFVSCVLLQSEVSEALRKAVPDAEPRLRGDDASWTSVFLEAAGKGVGSEVLAPLADRALKGVRNGEEAGEVAAAIAGRGMGASLPGLLAVLQEHRSHREPEILVSLLRSLGEEGRTAGAKELLAFYSLPDVPRWNILRPLLAYDVPGVLEIARRIAVEPEEDEFMRLGAIDGLQRARDPKLPELLFRELTSKDDGMRAGGVRVLGRLNAPDAVARILPLLEDEFWNVRAAACDALGRLGAVEAKEKLVARLDDENDDVRGAAIEALTRVGLPQGAIRALLRRMADRDNERAVIEAVGRLRLDDAVPDLARRANGGNHEAALALGQIGSPSAVHAILDLAKSVDPSIRRIAAYGMGRVADPEPLRALLGAADVDVRLAAWEAFARAGVRLDPAPLLKSGPLPIRAAALSALLGAKDLPPGAEAEPVFRCRLLACAGTREKSSEIEAFFRAALKDGDRDGADAAVRDLAELGHRGLEADLLRLIGEEWPLNPLVDLHYGAAIALCRMGVRQAVPAVLKQASRRLPTFDSEGMVVVPGRPDTGGISCLNALRKPQLYAKLGRTWICWQPLLEPEEFWTLVERESGLRVDAGPYGGWMRPWTEALPLRLPEGVQSIRDALEYVLMVSPFDFVLEDDRIRIVDRHEALRFWTSVFRP